MKSSADTSTLLFAATQDARHATLLRANEMARAMVERAMAKQASAKPDEDGVLPETDALFIALGVAERDITAKQRGFLHAAVLPQIAEQVRMPDGTRYVAHVWKEHLKDLFIADKWDMVRLPFVKDRKTGAWKPSKKKAPVKRRKSTEDLSIKGYSLFIDQCIAHATTEWGVVFRFDADERESVRYVKPARVAKKEAVAA